MGRNTETWEGKKATKTTEERMVLVEEDEKKDVHAEGRGQGMFCLERKVEVCF